MKFSKRKFRQLFVKISAKTYEYIPEHETVVYDVTLMGLKKARGERIMARRKEASKVHQQEQQQQPPDSAQPPPSSSSLSSSTGGGIGMVLLVVFAVVGCISMCSHALALAHAQAEERKWR